MLYCFPIFLFTEFIILNVGDAIGKKLHPTSIKYGEIFQENFVGLIHYSLSSAVLSYIMYNNVWCLNGDGSVSFTETIHCMYNSFDRELYFVICIFEVSHYIISIINTLLWKISKRADQTMLFVHHIVTLVLIYGGLHIAFGEFASIYVLFTHNLCDIPIHIYLIGKNLKVANININDRMLSVLDNANGVILITMWVYLRLYMFGSFNWFIVFLYPDETDTVIKISLSVIYVFNIIWFFLALKGVYHELFMKREKSILYDKNE